MRWLLAIGATLALTGCLRFQTPRCLSEADCEVGSVCGPEGVCLKADPRCTLDSGVCGRSCAPCDGRCVYHGPPERLARAECIGGALEIECSAPFLALGDTCRPGLSEEILTTDAYPGGTRSSGWQLDRPVFARGLADGTLAVASVAGVAGETLELRRRLPGQQSWVLNTLGTPPGLILNHPVILQDAEGWLHVLVIGDADPLDVRLLGNQLWHFREGSGGWTREAVDGLAEDQGAWGKITTLRAVEIEGGFLAVAKGTDPSRQRLADDLVVLHHEASSGAWTATLFGAYVSFSPPALVRDPDTGSANLFFEKDTADRRLGWWQWEESAWRERTFEFAQPVTGVLDVAVALGPTLAVACVDREEFINGPRDHQIAIWPDRDPMLRPPLNSSLGHTCEPVASESGAQFHLVQFSSRFSRMLVETHEVGVDRSNFQDLATLDNSAARGAVFESGGALHIFLADGYPAPAPLRHLWIDP